MKIHLNNRLSKHFIFRISKNIILLLLVCFSMYSYYFVLTIKKDTEILNQSVSKINKELTAKLTVKPTIILTPTLTDKLDPNEYIFTVMPNGVVLSCKRNSQQALFQASTSLVLPKKEVNNCHQIQSDDCEKKCGNTASECYSRCVFPGEGSAVCDKKCGGDTSSECWNQCIHPLTKCSNLEAKEKNVYEIYRKLLNENCIGDF